MDNIRGNAGDDTDDREGDAEVVQQAPIAPQLLFVAQLGEPILIILPCHRVRRRTALCVSVLRRHYCCSGLVTVRRSRVGGGMGNSYGRPIVADGDGMVIASSMIHPPHAGEYGDYPDERACYVISSMYNR